MELKNKLEHLLHHWMEHNEGHAVEYEKWAKQAEEAGLSASADRIKAATRLVREANQKLREAANNLGE